MEFHERRYVVKATVEWTRFLLHSPFRGNFSNHDSRSDLPVRTRSLRQICDVLTFPHISCGIAVCSATYEA